MNSTKEFPRSVKLALALLREHGSMGMQQFSRKFESSPQNEPHVHGYRCLLTMKEDGLVEVIRDKDGHDRFHLTDKARELMGSGKI